MQEPRPLTTDEIRFFRYNGFLKLPWRLPSELVEAIKKQAADDIEQAVEPLFRDYRGDVMRLSAIWERGGAIREALGGPEVVPALQSLLGPDVEYTLNRHNHLTLRRRDDRTAMSIELHRDVGNWSRTICTILFYLEDTNLENGCTQVIPGSHLLPNVAPGLKAENDPVVDRLRAPGAAHLDSDAGRRPAGHRQHAAARRRPQPHRRHPHDAHRRLPRGGPPRRRVGPQARGGLRRTRLPGQRRQAARVDQEALTREALRL